MYDKLRHRADSVALPTGNLSSLRAAGSKALCAAALSALRSLLAALPDPDTLAFFLPGVVSGLSKQLLTAGEEAAESTPPWPAFTQ